MMKLQKLFVAVVILLTGIVTGFAEDEAEMRTWTTRDGGSLEAKLLKRESNTIFIEDEGGGQFKIAFAALSLGDQQYMAELKLPSVAPGNAVARHIKISSLVGEALETASGVEIPSDVLAGKVLGFYVSAKECKPCEGVTSNLIAYVDQLSPEYKSKFQIVYVGADTNAEDEKDYLKEFGRQWLSLPFDSEAKIRLLKRFKLNEAPALLFVRFDGTMIDKKGLRILEKDDVRMLEAMIKQYVR